MRKPRALVCLRKIILVNELKLGPASFLRKYEQMIPAAHKPQKIVHISDCIGSSYNAIDCLSDHIQFGWLTNK